RPVVRESCGTFHGKQPIAEPDQLCFGQGAQHVALGDFALAAPVEHRMAVVAGEAGNLVRAFHAYALLAARQMSENDGAVIESTARKAKGAGLAASRIAQFFADYSAHAACSPSRSPKNTPRP